jgi:hypothetical protein
MIKHTLFQIMTRVLLVMLVATFVVTVMGFVLPSVTARAASPDAVSAATGYWKFHHWQYAWCGNECSLAGTNWVYMYPVYHWWAYFSNSSGCGYYDTGQSYTSPTAQNRGCGFCWQ